MYKYFFKDLIDFYCAIILLIFFIPLILIVYLMLYVLIGSPIYKQKRPGYLNKPFIIFKFKTLIDKDCRSYNPHKKTFKFGTFLRKTGIDEIPQLLNILKGEMSFIGPRPLLMQYLKLKQFINHPRSKCIPGITGLAQVQGRLDLSLQERLYWDLEYIENKTLTKDLEIIFKTISSVLKKKGAN